MEEPPPPWYQTDDNDLIFFQGSWTGDSNDSVQQWIDSLTETDFYNGLDVESVASPAIKPGLCDDSVMQIMQFLPLPGSLGKRDAS